MTRVVPIATSLYTYAEGGRLGLLPVRHYGQEALFIRGRTGGSYCLGPELRVLVEHGGRDLDAPSGGDSRA